MNLKKLKKSKTAWTGLGLILYGVYNLIAGEGDKQEGINAIIFGIQTIFLRDAIAKVEK